MSDPSSSTSLICFVCGDTATGLHYGVPTCEACKAFFKRTIQGRLSYKCPASGKCLVSKSKRKQCQYCRFQKCILVGMQKEGVRGDSSHGVKRKKETPTPSVPTTPTLDINNVLDILSKLEPSLPHSTKYSKMGSGRSFFTEVVQEINNILGIGMRRWMKHLPGLSKLPLSDRINLAASNWPLVHALTLAWNSLPWNGGLRIASNVVLTEEDRLCAESPPADPVLRQCILKMNKLAITRNEYLLLKAIAFVNPNIAHDHEDITGILSVRDFYIRLLATLCKDARMRMANLLLLVGDFTSLRFHLTGFDHAVTTTSEEVRIDAYKTETLTKYFTCAIDDLNFPSSGDLLVNDNDSRLQQL